MRCDEPGGRRFLELAAHERQRHPHDRAGVRGRIEHSAKGQGGGDGVNDKSIVEASMDPWGLSRGASAGF